MDTFFRAYMTVTLLLAAWGFLLTVLQEHPRPWVDLMFRVGAIMLAVALTVAVVVNIWH